MIYPHQSTLSFFNFQGHMKTTTSAKILLAIIIGGILAIIVYCVLELIDYRPSSSGPEYVTYNWRIIRIPQPKPWFPWLNK